MLLLSDDLLRAALSSLGPSVRPSVRRLHYAVGRELCPYHYACTGERLKMQCSHAHTDILPKRLCKDQTDLSDLDRQCTHAL